MLFSSMTFLFVFLPVVCTIYFLAKKEIRNYVLLISSFIFYGWGEPRYLAIMILTILVNYVGARLIDGMKKDSNRKLILFLTVSVNLSFLIYFKYFNFLISNLNRAVGADFSFIEVIMPIGISFYTFQGLSYLVDVYRREVEAQKDLCNLALFISLFPQLVAGPIVKYHDIYKQIENRDVRFDSVVKGTKRFIIGLAKKVLIANTLALVADTVFALPVARIDAYTAWIGIISYTIQLYYDFSGYSDMAIGLGLIFGFRFLENFNYPYISKSVTEFWRRWHISLSTWFREYLYFPLGGNRISVGRTYFNLFVVFLATGVWHGASWSFVVWGMWHGFFIVMERLTGWSKETKGLGINAIKHVYAVMVFMLSLVIFRSDTIPYAIDYFQVMFGGHYGVDVTSEVVLTKKEWIMMIVGIVASVPLFKNILEVPYRFKITRTCINIYIYLLLVWSAISVASSTYNPFIYFRF